MSQMTQQQVNAAEVVSKKLTLNDVTVSGILSSIDSADNTQPDMLVDNGYLNVALSYLRKLANVIDPTGSGIPEQTLISNSLVVPYFQNIEEFELLQWTVDSHFNAHAIGGQTNNHLQIKESSLSKTGNYLLYIKVDKLPIAARIEVRVGDTWICTINEKGEYYEEIDMTTAVGPINLVAVNLASGTSVVLSSVEIYYIVDRFYTYLVQKVKSLATVTTDDFITREEFTRQLDLFTEQFQQATEQYLEKLNEHVDEENPHEITPDMIGAATVDHGHEGMVTEHNVQQIVSSFADDKYAEKDHIHNEYMTQDQLKGTVAQVIVDELSALTSVDSLTIVDGEIGILPSKLMYSDIDTPVQILLPTVISHNGVTPYDMNNGLVTTNKADLIHEAPKIFSLNSDFALLPVGDDVLNFRMKYHHDRKVKGYRIYAKKGLPSKWTVYSDDMTFVHEVTNAEFEDVSGSYHSEIIFDTDKIVNSLSFMFVEVLHDDPFQWELKIEILYNDFAVTEFGITNKQFQFTVSDKGTNRIVSSDATQIEPLKCTPKVVVPNIPLYVFGGQEPDESAPSYYSSYYQPEYNNTRVGSLALEDKYNELDAHIVSGAEQYQHPAFGNLSLKEGVTYPTTKLTDIYSSSDEGWMSDGNTQLVTIEQTFSSTNVVLCGYEMRWLEADIERIPEKWTLTIEGYTAAGIKNTIVLDSVRDYYPFYSAEEGDVVYAKRFTPNITITKIILTMEKELAHVISLNKLKLYLSERYHSISKNISYLGLTPVSQMCLGSVIYKDVIGWVANNLFIGKSVTVPVNNMDLTEDNTNYSFVNPYFTTDVYANIKNFILSSDNTIPSASILTISEMEGKIHSTNSARYAVTMSRVW